MTYDPAGNPPSGQYPGYPTGGDPGQYPAPGGYGSPVQGGQAPPPAYKGWAITSIVLGLIFSGIFGLACGIVATVYSGRVGKAWNVGDYATAEKASKRARGWAIAATILEVLGLIYIIAKIA
jgi:hypothetical protein